MNNYDFFQGQKFIWKIKKSAPDIIKNISEQNNLSIPVAQALYSRGFLDNQKINSFLFISELEVGDPKMLKDSDLAVERILKAIENKEKILIFGDYDVDGITSTALLLVALLQFGADINFHLPNREKDGYGLSEKFVKKAFNSGYKLIITVDNGITAHKAAELAAKLSVDLIITDHHRPHGQLPKALAIVDANRFDCAYPYKDLAGVGVAFKLVSLIYKIKNLLLPDKVYELLLLGTVADVAPLDGENRYWVRFGLEVINKQKSLAIKTLATNSNITREVLNSLDIGFSIAPQINALGRLDDPRDAVKFLISSDEAEVERIGKILFNINEERKKVDKRIYEEIEDAIIKKSIDLESENIIIAASSDWPAGVIGLVAGKLTQNYGKPAFLFHVDKDGFLKGSCRSIPEFNIFDALQECSDLLTSFGGHSFAAGLKLHQNNLFEFKNRFEQIISSKLTKFDLTPKIELDAFLDLYQADNKILQDLQNLEPFGNKNKQPAFLIRNLVLNGNPMLLKDRHLKIQVFADGVCRSVIFFNRPDLYSFFNNLDENKKFNLAANIVKNEWEGKIAVELQGMDVGV